jgi:hypothetical protein
MYFVDLVLKKEKRLTPFSLLVPGVLEGHTRIELEMMGCDIFKCISATDASGTSRTHLQVVARLEIENGHSYYV